MKPVSKLSRPKHLERQSILPARLCQFLIFGVLLARKKKKKKGNNKQDLVYICRFQLFTHSLLLEAYDVLPAGPGLEGKVGRHEHGAGLGVRELGRTRAVLSFGLKQRSVAGRQAFVVSPLRHPGRHGSNPTSDTIFCQRQDGAGRSLLAREGLAGRSCQLRLCCLLSTPLCQGAAGAGLVPKGRRAGSRGGSESWQGRGLGQAGPLARREVLGPGPAGAAGVRSSVRRPGRTSGMGRGQARVSGPAQRGLWLGRAGLWQG